MDLGNPPAQYWHCSVKAPQAKRPSIVNDLAFPDLKRRIVDPWLEGRPFSISGQIVKSPSAVSEIRIAHTTYPMQHYANAHNARMRARGISDWATNRALIPLWEGEDVTNDLLFSRGIFVAPEPNVELIIRICQRLPRTAKIIGTRSRKGKHGFEITDEYDVQDLLHAVIRAYVKYLVQEDPLPKQAAARSGRADLSIEELGVLIEVKYVRGPDDQRRIFEEYSQDLVLYTKWPHLKTLIFVIYNSVDLRDPEAFEKMSGPNELDGRRFTVRIVLA